jgi:subtilisin family serine protease
MTLPRWSGRLARGLALGVAVASVTAVGGAPAAGAPATGQVRLAGGTTAVPGSYLVVLHDAPVGARVTGAAVRSRAEGLARGYGATVQRTWATALSGFEATMTPAAAARLAASPQVRYVEQNHELSVADTQPSPPSWGLDRIDQANRPVDNSYTYPSLAGGAVRAYILDTGILLSHTDLAGRASSGFDAVDGGSADDCNGHGTHVAGTVGGTRYGVAKRVSLVAVRVLGCTGRGTTAGVIAGIDWVTANAVKPAVANMSLGGGVSPTLDSAVNRSIASGVSYVLAAGNSNANACSTSPARVPAAVTVGATTSTDARASYSNLGTCLDLFAPGSAITSAWSTGSTATRAISGTSMASPHVAGAAALVLAANPTFTPAQVSTALVGTATPGVVTGAGAGSPNLLLRVG